jgi:hypothetical protein
MRWTFAPCAVLAAAIAVAGTVQAAESFKHKGKHKRGYARAAPEAPRDGERYQPGLEPAWYPHDSSVLPFGSKLWWDQKAREGGGTRD